MKSAARNEATVETVRQMMADWNAATPTQREQALAFAAELAGAREKWQAARSAWLAAKTPKARRDADADVQFWGSQLAFLSHVGR
jgi:hypothetical protein